jgi:uncharacterized FAD-dependent dehydrogenase
VHISANNITSPLGYTDADLRRRLARKLRCRPELVIAVTVVRRSLDARPRNPEPRYVLSINAEVDPAALPGNPPPGFTIIDDSATASAVAAPTFTAPDRPIVVGAGPAGLLAAYVLAKAGARPILVERGGAAADRAKSVAAFWKEGVLNPESNVLYGEGGAGLFSDGKLTARTKDRTRCRQFLELLVSCGAPEETLIDAAPHLGTDQLQQIVPRICEGIISNGGEVRFGARLERLVVESDTVRAVVINGEEIPCSRCVLAVGHSARDVYTMLAEIGADLQAKPFAAGVRVELPQEAINRSQYGRFTGHPKLGPASFRITRKGSGNTRDCYTFCMCPGGSVIACASEPEHLSINGMSLAKRSLPMGNAGFLVPVRPGDLPDVENPAMAGIAIQRQIEKKAFAAVGNYSVPASLLSDFVKGQISAALPPTASCARATPCDLRSILPDFVAETLHKALPRMLRELDGMPLDDAIVYAAETRSSSAVRICRGPDGRSTNIVGLYPAGEGSGYSGGIVSSAIDGICAAEACCSG